MLHDTNSFAIICVCVCVCIYIYIYIKFVVCLYPHAILSELGDRNGEG